MKEPPFAVSSSDSKNLVANEEDDKDRESDVPKDKATDGEVAGSEDAECIGLNCQRPL